MGQGRVEKVPNEALVLGLDLYIEREIQYKIGIEREIQYKMGIEREIQYKIGIERLIY